MQSQKSFLTKPSALNNRMGRWAQLINVLVYYYTENGIRTVAGFAEPHKWRKPLGEIMYWALSRDFTYLLSNP